MSLTPRQQEIADQAIAVIARAGVGGLTVKTLAAAVGVSEPALYRHFANKQAILEAVLLRFDETANAVLRDSAPAAGLAGVERFFLDRCRQFAAQPELARLMIADAALQADPQLAPQVLAMMHRHGEVMVAMLRVAQERGEIRAAASPRQLFRVVFGALRLLVHQWCLSGHSFPLEAEGQRLWQDLKTLLQP